MMNLSLPIFIVFCLMLVSYHPNAEAYGDHDMARQLVLKGDILSLEEILKRTHSFKNGRLLEVELERISGKWAYEVVILNDNGQIVEHFLDAQTGQYLFSAGE